MEVTLTIVGGNGADKYTSVLLTVRDEGREDVQIVCDGNEDSFCRYLSPLEIVRQRMLQKLMKIYKIDRRKAIEIANQGLANCGFLPMLLPRTAPRQLARQHN